MSLGRTSLLVVVVTAVACSSNDIGRPAKGSSVTVRGWAQPADAGSGPHLLCIGKQRGRDGLVCAPIASRSGVCEFSVPTKVEPVVALLSRLRNGNLVWTPRSVDGVATGCAKPE